MTRRAICVALLAVGLLGFGKRYTPLSPTEPAATVRFWKGGYGVEFLYGYRLEYCAEGGKLATFNGWGKGSLDAQVRAGEKTLLWSQSVKEDRYNGTLDCISMTSFTPEAGHTYDVRHDLSGIGCRVVVTDAATGAPPPTARVEDAHLTCDELRRAAKAKE